MLSSNISYIWADSFPLPDRGVTSLRLSDHLSPNGFPELTSPRVTTNDSWQVLYSPIDWPELQTWNNAQACKQCLCKGGRPACRRSQHIYKPNRVSTNRNRCIWWRHSPIGRQNWFGPDLWHLACPLCACLLQFNAFQNCNFKSLCAKFHLRIKVSHV